MSNTAESNQLNNLCKRGVNCISEWFRGLGRDELELQNIDHVQLAIPAGGEGLAREFYGKLLGLNEVEKPQNLLSRGGVWFANGNLKIHLGVEKEFLPARKAHPAFKVKYLPELRKILETANYHVVDDEPLPDYDRFYVNDPFGNRIEFLEPV
jgi:catechol 2,3-dioxygenase-like lactoylglutathione lyase family enzyme